jgi:hypothetical protein
MMLAVPITILFAVAFLGVSVTPAKAFSECSTDVTTGGHWPNPHNTSNFGTQKWEFDWRVTSDEALEISNVQYTSDLSLPKKLLLKRASLPFVPVHYPERPPMCAVTPDFPHGYNDTIGTSKYFEPICCAHVPTTPCSVPDRTMACVPGTMSPPDTDTRSVGGCPSGTLCGGALDAQGLPKPSPDGGVCEGTQVDFSPPIEDGIGETASGAANADVVLTVAFRYGGYQFIQRWRFRDDGTLMPSLRLGGIHNCQLHSHQIYWRFNFQLAATPNETVQECVAGVCPDLGTIGWSSVAGCGVAATPSDTWRITDAGAAGRAVVVERGPNDGDPKTFCERVSSSDCPNGCFNTRDFCAVPAAEPHETFVSNRCDDHLEDAVGTAPDMAFWYVAHVDHHSPCDYLPMCDPAIGTVAFGPRIRLVGSW